MGPEALYGDIVGIKIARNDLVCAKVGGFRWIQRRLSDDLAWGYDDYWRAMLSVYLFQLELDPLILYRQQQFA